MGFVNNSLVAKQNEEIEFLTNEIKILTKAQEQNIIILEYTRNLLEEVKEQNEQFRETVIGLKETIDKQSLTIEHLSKEFSEKIEKESNGLGNLILSEGDGVDEKWYNLKKKYFNGYLYKSHKQDLGNDFDKGYRRSDKYILNGDDPNTNLIDGYILPFFKEWVSEKEINFFKLTIEQQEARWVDFLDNLVCENGLGIQFADFIYNNYITGAMKGKENREYMDKLIKKYPKEIQTITLKKEIIKNLHYKEYKNDNIDKKSFYDPNDKSSIKEICGNRLPILYKEFEDLYNDGMSIKNKNGYAKVDIILQRYQTEEHQLLNLAIKMKERGVF